MAQQVGQKVIIKVADNGYGIPEADQKQLFNKFFRAENVVSQSIEGTGLGLYIIKAITDISGGEITFYSNENEGTEFTITYPLSGMKPKEGSKKLS